MKKLIIAFLLIASVLTITFFWHVWQNNRDVQVVPVSEIEHAFITSINWLDTNYTNIENIENPILWWMIKQAALTSNNDSLNRIYNKYKKDHLDIAPPNLETPMFDKFYRPRVPDISLLSNSDDYQIFFLYALSCDNDLSSEPLIQRQLKPEFCSLHYLYPRCITHQLMGLRLMQRYQCGYEDVVTSTINKLQQTVTSELTWDFRVGDAYIQRVLMLVDTGAYSMVKPIWIKNILNAQNTDGSWDDLHPIFNLGDDLIFAHTSTLPTIKKPKGDFHATTQAIWLLSLLLKEHQPD